MASSTQQKKQFRAIGHKLKPVVIIAEKGLTDPVRLELDRALTDHELIKIKIAVGDRDARNEIRDQVVSGLGAECVQQIGHMLLLHRAARKPDPRLSNLLRTLN